MGNGRQKATEGDKIILTNRADKALRKKMGSKKGKIIQVFKVFGNDYMTSRMMYIVSFDTESVWLWSYQLTKVGKAR
jgi:hypothetical protein